MYNQKFSVSLTFSKKNRTIKELRINIMPKVGDEQKYDGNLKYLNLF